MFNKASWVRPVRTAVQAGVGLIVSFLAIVPALDLGDGAAAASVVAVSAVMSRVMAHPLVEELLAFLGISSDHAK